VDNLILGIAKTNIFDSLIETNTNAYADRIEQTLKKIHLGAYRNINAENLSYGQRKLLELGRAIIQDADIYLLDEPFTGLFPAMIEQVMNLILELKHADKTIVIIEHNMGLIKQLSDYTIVLNHGKLLASDTTNKVLADKNVQQAYLGV
jgi:neutral amino acid transport system ATP-binding protein